MTLRPLLPPSELRSSPDLSTTTLQVNHRSFFLTHPKSRLHSDWDMSDGEYFLEDLKRLVMQSVTSVVQAEVFQSLRHWLKSFNPSFRPFVRQQAETPFALTASLPDWIKELCQALENQDFSLSYQPQIHLATGELFGVETLLRWQHPQLGFISPAHFIPIAEKTGLIVPMGYWVLRQSCRQYQQWQREGIAPFKLSVNLSLRQLQEPDLVQRIQEILRETGMNPQHLALEITESLMFQEPDKAIARLHQLKRLGIQIAIDDFGVGYSSLSYLKDLPIQTLKIDKSFLDDLLTIQKNQVILQSIIELGHRLTLNIIAEGIENQEQLTVLRQMNCDYGQGYFFSRPLEFSDITQYFHHQLVQRQDYYPLLI